MNSLQYLADQNQDRNNHWQDKTGTFVIQVDYQKIIS